MEDSMAKRKEKLGSEIKGLGGELSKAIIKMKNSTEFKKLQGDMVSGLKSVASSVTKALKAAQKSPSAGRIKIRLKRVVKAGKSEGLVKVRKAEALAAKKIKQATRAIKNLSRKVKPEN